MLGEHMLTDLNIMTSVEGETFSFLFNIIGTLL
jgi:hypothetical protein